MGLDNLCRKLLQALNDYDVIFIQLYNNENIFFLLGYLNSNFFRDYYLSCGSRRGGRMIFTQRMLHNIKIPLLNNRARKEIADIVKQVIDVLYDSYIIVKVNNEIDLLLSDALFRQT
jgi:restriction endonuclease S subunit